MHLNSAFDKRMSYDIYIGRNENDPFYRDIDCPYSEAAWRAEDQAVVRRKPS
ncbi:hypothetical protein [Salinisphaera sp.]|uniref:hypothetical protein n=1 Tax=Salinisphaera sp. TaxID=1914330 RepID=UPI002D79C9C6|nr:hypothetical protein [Salinisphaera sp.]HET7313536.1 hypothetical protein [Salinisphaera sp.]